MKKLIIASLSIFCLMSMSLNAQMVNEGYLKLEITDVSSDDEQTAMMLEMMKGTQTEIFFADGKNLSTMDMMGGMVKMKTLYDKNNESVDMLFDMMGQKMHVASTTAEMEKETADQAEAMEDFKIEYKEDDVKEIVGHKCVKTIITDPKTGEVAFELYVARGIKASSQMIQGLQHFELEGFPLEVIIKQAAMTMVMTATEFKKVVDAAVFALETGGYTKMTFKEFMEKMGSMGGGGGGFGF